MKKEIPEEIIKFIKNLLYAADEFGYGEEVPDGLLNELYVKLDERISTYLLAKMPADKIDEYRTIKDKGGSTEMLDVFLMRNIPDYKETMKSAYKDFYDNYLEESRERRLGVIK